MLVATVSASQVQCLTSLLIQVTTKAQRGPVKKLMATARDPKRAAVVWAAINYFNIGLHSRIKSVTHWDAIEVLEFLVSVQWSSQRRNLDSLRDALDCAREAKAMREGKTPNLSSSVYVGRWP